MSVAVAIRKMLAAGLTVEQALLAAEAMEEATARPSAGGDDAAERRRAWDRERKRKQRSSAKSGGSPVESGGNPQSPVDSADSPRAPACSNISLPSGDNKNPSSRGKKTTGVVHPLPLNEAFEAWNGMASKAGLQTVRDHSSKRVRALQDRLRDHGMDGWRSALDVVSRSQFLTGQNDRGWRASFDFVVKAENFTKIIEGVYAKPGDKRAAPAAASGEIDWQKRLSYARSAKRWWPDDWGPMPGTPGCQVPHDLIRPGDGDLWFEKRTA